MVQEQPALDLDRVLSLALRRYLVHMDANADAEGNYTLLARRPHPNLTGTFGLYPVGGFQYLGDAAFPVS